MKTELRQINLLLEMDVVWWFKHGYKSINSFLKREYKQYNVDLILKA